MRVQDSLHVTGVSDPSERKPSRPISLMLKGITVEESDDTIDAIAPQTHGAGDHNMVSPTDEAVYVHMPSCTSTHHMTITLPPITTFSSAAMNIIYLCH